MVLNALLLLLFAATAAFSQATSGLIHGVVSDSSGAVLSGVTVTATKTDTQVSRTVATNTDGNFVFPGLAPGLYSVSCEQQGFRKFVREGILLEVN
ncbi:MAG: carboxypeptidase regulatory-like domain-containing protein [Acidobacteria bacterium]|nr:carboxypeptidase regulatory-like domain-containing protein [Acidobacteriota bacterium]